MFSFNQPSKLLCRAAFSVLLSAAVFSNASAQTGEEFTVMGGGTFSKPKIMSSLQKLAIGQAVIRFRNATTKTFEKADRGMLGRKKLEGAHVSGRLTAYLETTDSELTSGDYQELADYFYHAMNRELKKGGIDTVAWSTIAATDFYQDADGEEDKDKEEQQKGGNIYTQVVANNGKVLWGGTTGFAFGKLKKGAKFCEAVGAPAVFMYLTIDFAEITLDGEGRTSEKAAIVYAGGNAYHGTLKRKMYKFNSDVDQNLKVAANGGNSYFFTEKMGSEVLVQQKDIPSGAAFASAISEDENKPILKRPMFTFSKDFKATPVVIETTREKYKAAARAAIDNYAMAFVAKAKTPGK